ncbi:hypothetical protein [Micromonospora sp. M71_S20]|uniref:hypothetical protein n=1 Tax=Micromonospora sp. M71_S20 TaxID=592872 RepID=UPI0011E5BB8F|nr:hypothetical protein [Micromonospora sp. M71_S20]
MRLRNTQCAAADGVARQATDRIIGGIANGSLPSVAGGHAGMARWPSPPTARSPTPERVGSSRAVELMS